MDKYIYDKNNSLWYELQGKYYLPCLTLPPEEEKPIGIWGQRHLRYIKKHKQLFYVNLLTSGGLNSYLAGINEQAEELFLRLVKEFAEKKGITEELKNTNQMAWIDATNNVQARAREIVNALIYNDNFRFHQVKIGEVKC